MGGLYGTMVHRPSSPAIVSNTGSAYIFNLCGVELIWRYMNGERGG